MLGLIYVIRIFEDTAIVILGVTCSAFVTSSHVNLEPVSAHSTNLHT